jgi:predicted AlkP superfamily pyrophosphatase or phosphodiesterase
MRKLVAALLGLLATGAAAQPVRRAQQPPRLLIVISVDQFSADLFDEYRGQFTGGLARLARGTVFRNGYQAHAATETCPGHSTILTGSHPAHTGIVANYWYDPRVARPDKQVYCAEDERVPGSSSTSYRVSPLHLRVPTLGDMLKASSPRSLNVAVAGKDRAAVMMSGHRADQRWYWTTRGFTTDLQGVTAPRGVAATNAAVAAMIAAQQAPLAPPPFCAARARPIQVGRMSVGTGRFERAAGDEPRFRASPAFDGAVLALAGALIQEMRLGADNAPDVLSIGLSATDYVGHRYGTEGQEMCLQMVSLDRDLGDFFSLLDRSGIDYAVALTADHGMLDLPERARLRGVAGAARVNRALAASAVGAAVGQKVGLSGTLLIGEYAGDIYLNPAIPAAVRPRVLQEALALYRAHPQVAAAFSEEELRRTRIPTSSPDRWSLAERARASFDPERSGDIVVLLRPNVTPIAEAGALVATHGSPWDYDRRVPILLWRRGMAGANRNEAVSTVNILPTLAAMLGLRISGRIDGRCLSMVQGTLCPRR